MQSPKDNVRKRPGRPKRTDTAHRFPDPDQRRRSRQEKIHANDPDGIGRYAVPDHEAILVAAENESEDLIQRILEEQVVRNVMGRGMLHLEEEKTSSKVRKRNHALRMLQVLSGLRYEDQDGGE